MERTRSKHSLRSFALLYQPLPITGANLDGIRIRVGGHRWELRSSSATSKS